MSCIPLGRYIEVQLSSLHRALVRAGLSSKKGLIAAERDRPALRQARRDWIMRRQPRMRQEPHRLVFIDETTVKTNLARLRGRTPVGDRLYGAAFDTYIETQLVPVLEPVTIVILDNLSTHKSPRAAEAMRKRGCWFLFLTAYSPDLSPIEMAFSKLKAHLRRVGARTFDALFQALGGICPRWVRVSLRHTSAMTST